MTSEIVLKYLLSKFDTYKIVGYNSQEFTTNSIFAYDNNFHMSVNLSTGLWQCFKTKKCGNFVKLVSELESISYDNAEDFLIRKYCRNINFIEKHIKNFFSTPEELTNETISKNSINILKYGTPIDKSNNTILKNKANVFLEERGFFTLQHKFLLADKKSPFFGRLIIPFIDNSNTVFFFQARTLFNENLKYLNPSIEECGVKCSDVLYPFDKEASHLFLVEGPVDCITLQKIGVNATSLQGSSISKTQIKLIKNSGIKKIILSMDNDETGRLAEKKIKSKMLKSGFDPDSIYICHPTGSFKDWNEMYSSMGRLATSGLANSSAVKFNKLEEIYSIINGNSSE